MLLHTQPSLVIFMHTKVWKPLGKTKRRNQPRQALIVECWFPENTSKTSCGEGKPEFTVHDGEESLPSQLNNILEWKGAGAE